MEITMNESVGFTMVVIMFVYTALAVWLITRCRNMLAGILVTAAAVAGGYGIYQYAYYITLAVIWTVRFAAVIAVMAFIVGFYPGKDYSSQPQ